MSTITDDPTIFDELVLVPIDQLCPAEDNVRTDVGDVTDLAESIFQNGLLQPIRAQRYGDHDTYLIVAGHRRHAAINLLIDTDRWPSNRPVPVMVSAVPLEDYDRVAAMLVENMQRSDLNPMEEGRAFYRLTKEFKFKTADLAHKVGRSSSYITDRIALLKLPTSLHEAVAVGNIPLTIASALARVGDDDTVLKLTSAGKKIPSVQEIDRAVAEVAAKKLEREFKKALESAGIEVATEAERFGYRNNTELIATPESPKEIAGLLLPKRTKAFITVRDWEGKVIVELRKLLTEKELAKLEAARKSELTEKQAELEAERAERFAKETANWSPEQLAWHAECERLRAEHEARVSAHRDEVNAARRSWVEKASAKDVARWAMMDVAMERPWNVARYFDLVVKDGDAAGAVAEFCSGGAANLVEAVAFSLGIDYGNDGPAGEAMVAFVEKAVDLEPTLELPPEPRPETNESGEPMTDEEWEAVQEIARQNAAEEGEYDYDGDDD